MERSVQLYRQKDFERCLLVTKKILRQEPANVDAYEIIMKCLYKLGKIEECLRIKSIADKYITNENINVLLLAKHLYFKKLDAIVKAVEKKTGFRPLSESNQGNTNQATKPRGQEYFGNKYLPSELINLILSHLSFAEYFVLMQINRKWRDFIKSNRKLYKSIEFSAKHKKLQGGSFVKICKASGGTVESIVLDSLKSVKSSHLLQISKDCPPRKLKTLRLVNMRHVSAQSVERFTKYSMRSLTCLDFSFMDCMTYIKYFWRNCPSLQSLKLIGCSFKGFPVLQYPKESMRSIDISDTQITQTQLGQIIEVVPHLTELVINDCPLLDIRAFSLITSLKKLKTLSCNALSKGSQNESQIDDAFLFLASSCTRLESLSLARCPFVSPTSASYLAEFLSDTLTLINLGSCGNLTDEAISAFSVCSKLESLNVSMCTWLTDNGILSIIKACMKLKTLAIASTLVSDACLEFCKGLEFLNVSGCSRLSGHAILSMCRSSSLKTLIINNLPDLTLNVVQAIKRTVPKVQHRLNSN